MTAFADVVRADIIERSSEGTLSCARAIAQTIMRVEAALSGLDIAQIDWQSQFDYNSFYSNEWGVTPGRYREIKRRSDRLYDFDLAGFLLEILDLHPVIASLIAANFYFDLLYSEDFPLLVAFREVAIHEVGTDSR